MTCRTSCFFCVAQRTDADPGDSLNPSANMPALPVWRASLRMAVISAASVAATALIATGLTG